MRRALALLFLLCAAAAHAQLVALCPNLPAPTANSTVLADTTTFSCAPGPIGSGTTPYVRQGAGGMVAWWFCPTPTGWERELAVGTAAWFNASSLSASLRAAAAASDPLAALNAMMQSNASASMAALAPVWCPVWPEIAATSAAQALVPRASAPPPPPPPPPPPVLVAYVVATNGTATTRPTYRGDAATLTVNTSKALLARSPIGAACSGPAFKSGTSSTVYMTYAGAPDATTVTVCVVKKP